MRATHTTSASSARSLVVVAFGRIRNSASMKSLTLFALLVVGVAAAACRNPVDLQCNGLGLEPREFPIEDDLGNLRFIPNRYTVPNRAGGINGDCLTLYDSLGFRSR